MQPGVPLSSACPVALTAGAADGAAERIALRREAERLAEAYAEPPLPGVDHRALVERIERDLLAKRSGASRG